jgi:LPXTG-motif cell wall-anchored protein
VIGDATGGWGGLDVSNIATVTVGGNVSSTSDYAVSVFCEGNSIGTKKSEVFIAGNVVASGANSVGAHSRLNGQITINGTITSINDDILCNSTVPAKNPTSLKSGYDQYSLTPLEDDIDAITVVWLLNLDPPTLTGPSALTLILGYPAATTDLFMVTGSPQPTVTKTSGNPAITWNDTAQCLDIAPGLAVGSYPVELTASNGIDPDATLTFTLTVTAQSSQNIPTNDSPAADSAVPQTGDNHFNLLLLAVLFVASGLGLTGMAVYRRRRQEKDSSRSLH